MPELQRCPWCGGKMKLDYKIQTIPRRSLRYAVVHVSRFYWSDKCGLGGTGYDYETEKDAVDAWNNYRK